MINSVLFLISKSRSSKHAISLIPAQLHWRIRLNRDHLGPVIWPSQFRKQNYIHVLRDILYMICILVHPDHYDWLAHIPLLINCVWVNHMGVATRRIWVKCLIADHNKTHQRVKICIITAGIRPLKYLKLFSQLRNFTQRCLIPIYLTHILHGSWRTVKRISKKNILRMVMQPNQSKSSHIYISWDILYMRKSNDLSGMTFILMCLFKFISMDGIKDLVQDYSISSALPMDILQSCTKPSTYNIIFFNFLIMFSFYSIFPGGNCASNELRTTTETSCYFETFSTIDSWKRSDVHVYGRRQTRSGDGLNKFGLIVNWIPVNTLQNNWNEYIKHLSRNCIWICIRLNGSHFVSASVSW